jgi:hypothetical protein
MANEITITQLAGSLPDVVRRTALKARYAAAVIMSKILSADGDVAKAGDRVSLSIMPSVSVNDVGSGGSVTNQQLSITSVEIVVDKWKEATVDVDDQAVAQSALAVIQEFSQAFGKAIAAQQDGDVAALHSSLTTYTVGDGTQPLDDAMVRLAKLKLDKADIPMTDRFWVLSPDAHADLIALARFSEAQATGLARGLQVSDGLVKGLYGDPVYVSNKIVTSTGIKKNLYLHKEALGIATQRNFKIETLARTKLSTPVCGHILYGVKVLRANHGVVVNSAVNADA